MKFVLIFTFTFAAAVHAQELLPDLQPFAAKHKAEVAALEYQKTDAISRVRQSYLAALDAAERSATVAGQLPVVAAVTRERDAVNGGQISPAFPADLPKTLQSVRQSYQASTARINADAAASQQRLDADYLRALATLQSRAAINPELAKQLAAEKAILLQNRPRPTSVPPEAKQFNGKWYRFYPGHCSWTVARGRCTRDGGQLAVIPDEPTEAFVRDLAKGSSCWLGASCERTHRRWTWVDGTPLTYTAWGPNQPDNWGGHQFYVQLTNGIWDDTEEDEKSVSGYICEWK